MMMYIGGGVCVCTHACVCVYMCACMHVRMRDRWVESWMGDVSVSACVHACMHINIT